MIRIRSAVAQSEVLFEVIDSGPGLKPEDFDMLFVRYARLSNKPTRGEKSSGLGLAICKELVMLHCGQIGARNNEGGAPGATFWFTLPRYFPEIPCEEPALYDADAAGAALNSATAS
jgi:two-component system, sensor histidine kinase and response regulator